MQFNQMNPPFCEYNNYGPQFEFNRQIIGEGDITSLAYPDGSVRYFFLPISQWCLQMCNSQMNNANPTWSPNVVAWLVRSINNTQPPPFFLQLRQRMPEATLQKQFFELGMSKSDRTFKLKFHNDVVTSTTDLVYFYPSLRTMHSLTETQRQVSGTVKVELPPRNICPCKAVQPCACDSGDEAVTSMSVDDLSSSRHENEKASKVYLKNCRCKMRNKTKKHATCQCDDLSQPSTKNKFVTTFADQASNCLDKSERPTQTSKSTSSSTPKTCSSDDIKRELWLPKTSFSKKAMKSKPSRSSSEHSDCSCPE